MHKRRLARETVLQALYRLELTGCSPQDSIDEMVASRKGLEQESKAYAERLFGEIVAHLDLLDRAIERHSAHWSLERMSVIDRNILRIGACEILYIEDVPFRVAIDEAVELAKRFGTKDSGRFINGILDSIAKSGRYDSESQPLQGGGALPVADRG